MQQSNNNNIHGLPYVKTKPVSMEWPELDDIDYQQIDLPKELQKYWTIELSSYDAQKHILMEMEEKISVCLGRPMTKADLESWMASRKIQYSTFQ